MSAGYWIAGAIGAAAIGTYLYMGFNPSISVESNGASCYPEARYDLTITLGRLFSKRKIGLSVTKDKGSVGLASKPSFFGDVWVEPSKDQIPTCKSVDINNGQAATPTYGLMAPKRVDVVYYNPFTKKKRILKTIDNSFLTQ